MNIRPSSHRRQRGAASTWVFGGFALVALFFLLTEHRAHLFGWLPFLLLAACPLMHFFHGGHGGHGRHGGHGDAGGDGRPPWSDEPRAPAETATKPDAHHHH
jgi:hypothetical protein